MLHRTGLKESWRPADKPVVGYVSRGYVRPHCNRCRAVHAGRGGGDRRRRDNEQPRRTEIALWSRKVRHCIGPDGSLSGVHPRRMIGLFGAVGNLFRRMLRLVQGRTDHPARGKRHEQKPGQNGATSVHERSWKSMQLQGANQHGLSLVPRLKTTTHAHLFR